MKHKSQKRRKRVSIIPLGGEKDFFAENLSMLLSAGIGVSASILIISEGASSGHYKRVLNKIATELDEGSSLWKALEGRGIFNHSYLYMAKVGEDSGRLSDNLGIIAEQERKNKSFQSKLVSALIYPGIILALTLVIGIGVVWFVMPNMAKIFSNMQTTMPLPTMIMINIGDYVTKNPTIVLSYAAILLSAIVIFFFIPVTKRVGQAILFRTPRIKDLIKEVEVARFGYVMYSLAQAGIPLTEALSSIEQSTSLVPYRKFYRYLVQNINDGNSLEKSFRSYKRLKRLFPLNIQQMIIAGERSGNFINVLSKISGIYEEKIDITSKNLSVILEPMLLFVVWLGVLFLALAIIMPIYGLIGGLDGM